MFISPLTAIEKGWIKFPDWMSEEQKQKCIQANAVDITIDRAFVHDFSIIPFELSEDHKQMIKQTELNPEDEIFVVPANGMLDIMSDFYVTVPAGVVASFIVRSTLNRNGLFVTNGLYDQGWIGPCGAILHNRAPISAYIKKHTRVAQLYFIAAQDSGIMYNGDYNNAKQGQHWSHNFNEPKQHQSFSTGNNVGEFTVDPTKSEYL